MVRNFLKLALYGGLGFAFLIGGYFLYLRYFSAPAQTSSPPSARRAPIDVDALASRMKSRQDIYQQLRDQALAVYGEQNPGTHSYDPQAKEAIQLAAYLWVWGDFYGEGLAKRSCDDASFVTHKGCADPFFRVVSNAPFYIHHYSTKAIDADPLRETAETLATSGYPDAFKLEAYQTAISDYVSVLESPNKTDPALDKTVLALPDLIDAWMGLYGKLVSAGLPDDLVYAKGLELLDLCKEQEDPLKRAGAGIDTILGAAELSAKEGVKDALEGRFYVEDAWLARGSGWANTITPQGQQDFEARLATAEQILTAAYAHNPQQIAIARNMLGVELGQGQGRERMETWFGRAMAVDPDDFMACQIKETYLLPRWHGSNQEAWNFGVDCAKGENWESKIPLILIDEAEYLQFSIPDFYADGRTWKVLDAVFRGYLQHYPNSIFYRSRYARFAVLGSHWDIAREQFQILGRDWDRDVFSDEEYSEMSLLAKENPVYRFYDVCRDLFSGGIISKLLNNPS